MIVLECLIGSLLIVGELLDARSNPRFALGYYAYVLSIAILTKLTT